MVLHRPFCLALLTLAISLLAVPPLTAADKEKVVMDADTKKATARALEWLVKQQNTDGSWSDRSYQHNTAITSFALLALMSQGHVPGQGMYGPEVAKACRFLLASGQQREFSSKGERKSGLYLIGARGGNMYCHGMATLALAELWGMTGDEEIKPVLQKAVDLIVGSQSSEGGWRYDPNPSGADISITIMQVMALRAAKNGGLHVPDETLNKAIRYIESCYDEKSGGFTYQPKNRQPGFARTAAGVCVLHLTGNYKAERIPGAIKYLKSKLDDREHFWYGHYYACHAFHQIGGKDWEDYYSKMRSKLLAKQSPDSSWSSNDLGSASGAGSVYQTSIAVILLSVPTHYLPIFQK